MEITATYRYLLKGMLREYDVSAHSHEDTYDSLKQHFLHYTKFEDKRNVQLIEIVLRER